MTDDERRLENRFVELAERAETRGRSVYSEFLTEAEQALLLRLRLPVPVELLGGYGGAERRLARFGEGGDEPPLTLLCIEPLSRKFADALTHRDFLGALMSLGLRRETLGDIVVKDNCGWLFCLGSAAAYIAEQLTEVRHSSVRCALRDALPPELDAPPEPREFVVASERLDAAVAAVFELSRGDSQQLFRQGRVFVGGREEENCSRVLRGGETVSVRGFGRFVYEGILRETRRGRLRIAARVYK